MVRSYLVCVMVFGLCVLGSGEINAGGRNHHTSICDEAELVGAAYGACNAYCEALDCDGDSPNGNPRACTRALDRFLDLTGELPPCEALCPCSSGWLAPEFIPSDVESAECYVEINASGAFMDLQIQGGLNEDGSVPMSAAAVDVFDDEVGGFHHLGCFSDRFEDGRRLEEESAGFEMMSTFPNQGEAFDRHRTKLFNSCRKVLRKVAADLEVECTVVDLTSN